MPYLTKSNSLKILSGVDFKKIGNLAGDIYKKPIYFFSDYEKNRLLVLEELFKDPDKFIDEFYIPINVTDHLRYVYESGKPAYHSTSDCERLNSNFRNFEIPKEIRELGRDEVIRFREWFKRYQYLLEKPDIVAFQMNLSIAFKLELDPMVIEYLNSGFEYNKNLNLVELERNIDKVIEDAGRFFNQSTDHIKSILKRFQKYTFLGYSGKNINNNDTGMSDEDLKVFLKKYDSTFKIPIKNLLTEYYRVKHNPDLKFEGNLLEQLGFKPCSFCYSPQIDTKDVQIIHPHPEVKSATLALLGLSNESESSSDDIKIKSATLRFLGL